MTLDEAICHAKEVAKEQLMRAGRCTQDDKFCDKYSNCIKCAEEHHQLAEWLKDYKRLKEKEEPKMVIYTADGYADGQFVYDIAECPNCGYEYEDGDKDWGLSFCPNCGQKLDWESEEV